MLEHLHSFLRQIHFNASRPVPKACAFAGLQFMGVGEDIVRLAFGALVIGGAVTGTLAFGLGGRNWASPQLEKLDETGKSGSSGSSQPTDRGWKASMEGRGSQEPRPFHL